MITGNCKALAIASLLLLNASCASKSHLGTRQSDLAPNACSITSDLCYFSSSGLSSQGRNWELHGFYSLQGSADGVYTLNGKVKFEYDYPTITRLEFLDLAFVFFEDDVVVHEEKIRVNGPKGIYLEFSRAIKSDPGFESSDWVWFDWRASE